MNRSQLVDKIAEKAELTKKDADKFLSAYIETVTEALQQDDKVALVGFGIHFFGAIACCKLSIEIASGSTNDTAASSSIFFLFTAMILSAIAKLSCFKTTSRCCSPPGIKVSVNCCN